MSPHIVGGEGAAVIRPTQDELLEYERTGYISFDLTEAGEARRTVINIRGLRELSHPDVARVRRRRGKLRVTIYDTLNAKEDNLPGVLERQPWDMVGDVMVPMRHVGGNFIAIPEGTASLEVLIEQGENGTRHYIIQPER